MLFLAAEVQLPWPLVWLVTLASIIIAISGGLVFVRSSSVQSNLKLLREERDDYREAYQHKEEENGKLQTLLKTEQETCKLEIEKLNTKVSVLENVVTGTTAVKELGDLMTVVMSTHHAEILAGINATNSYVKSTADAVWALLGDNAQKRRDDGVV